MRAFVISFCVILSTAIPHTSFATSDVGFVEGLWFSADTFIAEKPVRMYAAVRNHSGSDVTGVVTFLINDQTIKTQSVAALDNRVIEAWTDWIPSAGTHTVRATFSDIQIDPINEPPRTLTDETELTQTITVQPRKADDPSTDTPTHTSSSTHNERAGLEQYLAPSPARSILTRITDWSSSTRRTIEKSRQEQRRPTSTDQTAQSSTSTNTVEQFLPATTSTTTQTQSSTVDSATVLKNILDGIVYAGSTFLLSIVSRPVLVQVGLLCIILYGIYRFARRVGQRR